MNEIGIVHKKDNQWFFWDESLSEEYGPFLTEQEALEAWKKYVGY